MFVRTDEQQNYQNYNRQAFFVSKDKIKIKLSGYFKNRRSQREM